MDKATPWQGGIAALSNFGFGGSNVHMLLSGKTRQRSQISISAESAGLAPQSPLAIAERNAYDTIPLATRTAEGMAELVQAIKVSVVTMTSLNSYRDTWRS